MSYYNSDSGRYSDSDLERRRRMAEAMLAASQGSEPIGSWTQGVNKLAQALIGGYKLRKIKGEDAANQQAGYSALIEALGGMGGDAATPSASVGSPGGGIGSDDVASTESYIRQAAQQRGIDPDVAVRVAKSEGLAPGVYQSNFTQNGKREPSYGPFQLYTGGGLGNEFQQTTGLDPRDPKTVKQQIDFSLDQARQGGWGPWHGAQRVGIGNWQGINRGQAGGAPQDMAGAALPNVQPVASAPSPDVMRFLGGGAQPQQAGLSIGPPDAPIPQPRPPVERMNAGGGATAPVDPRIAAAAQGSITTLPFNTAADPRQPQPRPPVMPQPRPEPPQAPLPQPRPVRPAVPIQPPAQAALPPAAVASPAPPAAGPISPQVQPPVPAIPPIPPKPAAGPQRQGPITNDQAMSAQEFARQGQNYLRGIPSFPGQAQRAIPAGQPKQPSQGLLQSLLGRAGSQGAGMSQGAPTGSPVAGMAQQAGGDPRQRLAAILMNPNIPDGVKSALLTRMMPPPSEPYTLTPGAQRFGPNNQQVAAVPAQPEKPILSFEQQLELRKAGANSTNVSVGAQEKEYEKTRGKALAEKFGTIQDAAGQAQGKIATLDAMQQALGGTDYTGWGAEGLLQAKRFGQAIGIDTGNLGPAETAQAIGNQLTMQLRNPSGGAGMPGAMSDADRNFLRASVPGIARTPQGNAQLIEFSKRMAQRDVDVAQRASEYAQAHGRLDDGFEAELRTWSKANPLFTKESQTGTPMPQGTPLEQGRKVSPIVVNTPEEAAKLPSGTVFRTPDGRTKVVP